MLYTITNDFELLDSLPRLMKEDIQPNYQSVRVYRTDTADYIQLEDYLQLEEIDPNALFHIVNENNLDIDRVMFMVDEAHIIDNPHMINTTRHNINPNKVVVKKMNTDNYARVVKEAIEDFEQTGSWDKFDNLLLERKSWMLIAAGKGIHKAAGPAFKDAGKEAAKGIAKLGAVAAGTGALAYGIQQYGKHKADQDARIPINSGKRSELIKKLRLLNGKYEEYESKYDKADYARKNIIQKILYKIKLAIKRLRGQLAA